LISAQDARACGDGADYEEEEVIDLAVSPTEQARELSHFVVPRSDAPTARRFTTTADGSRICYADRHAESFVAESVSGDSALFAAPNGGIPRFGRDGRTLFLQVNRGDAYTKLVLANPRTGASQVWDDFLDAEPFALAPGGVVVAHGVPSGGALSWVTGAQRTTEVVRTPEVPKHLSVKGGKVAYFNGGDAFALELGEEAPSRAVGTLPEPATGAVLTDDGLVATSERGAWLLREGQKPRLLFTARGLAEPFVHGRTLVLHGAYGARFGRAEALQVLEAPHGNLHFVGPDAGPGRFLVCRGPRVESYDATSRQVTTLARGREGMKLRGAARFGSKVLTWSSRTWELVQSERRALPPPADFLLE
jgi:hypothetical protein